MSFVSKVSPDKAGPRMVSIEAVATVCEMDMPARIELEDTLKGLAAEYALRHNVDPSTLYQAGKKTRSIDRTDSMIHQDVVVDAISKGLLMPKEGAAMKNLAFFRLSEEEQIGVIDRMARGELNSQEAARGWVERLSNEAGLSDQLPQRS